jgi:hypothetical protein
LHYGQEILIGLNFIKAMGVLGEMFVLEEMNGEHVNIRAVKEVVATRITRGERSSEGTAQAISAAVRERSCADIVSPPRGLERASGAITVGIYRVKLGGYVSRDVAGKFFREMHDACLRCAEIKSIQFCPAEI